MRDEKNMTGSGADLNADDLLARLKQSYDGADSEGAKPIADMGKADARTLEIDDSVYGEAKDTLRSAEAMAENDDSELDVDELIDMYITKPRAKREAQDAQNDSTGAVIEELVRPDDDLSDTQEFGEILDGLDELEVLDKLEELPEDMAQITDAIDAGELFEEPVAEDTVQAEGALPEYADGDAKAVEPDGAALDESAFDEASRQIEETDVDDVATAVFDISMVKAIADAAPADDDMERAIDEAFAESATEVFTPVNDADLEGATVEHVYGQADTGEVDQTDLHIMLAFGMEEQLKQTVGEEEATKIEEDIIQRHEETAQIQTVEENLEYTTRDQNNEIISKYVSRYKSVLFRMVAAVALLIGVFFVENFSMLGLTAPEFMRPTSYPIVYTMIDLQLVVLAGVLVYRQLIDAYKGIFEKRITAETLVAGMLVLSVIYSVIVSITAPVDGFALYNLPVMFAVLLALVCEFMGLKREMYSFNVVASRKKKFVVAPVSEETESLEREVFGDFIPGEAQIVGVAKTDFVDGFFERSNGRKTAKPIIAVLLAAALVLSLVFMIIGAIGGRVYGAFTAAFMALMFTVPLTLFTIYSYPFYKASRDAFDNESAIIGESSLEQYSTCSVISFEDKEVFPSSGVKVTSIKVFGQNRIDEIIYNVASAFMKVGGPLADVFAQATQDMGYSEDVELVEVDDDGFTVTINGEPVYLGKASYMEKNDYDPPFDNEARRQEQNAATGVLYLAFGGQLAAKIYVQYTIDGEFEGVLAQLYKTGMCVGIKSFDPNIDDLLLAKKIKAMKYPVKVIRSRNVEDIPHTLDRSESGVVSKRSVKALLRTVALCEKVCSVIKTNLIVGILAMLIGAVVMIFVSAFGGFAMPSLYVLLYQLFWMIPVVIISRLLI